jgi:hypothetical protein
MSQHVHKQLPEDSSSIHRTVQNVLQDIDQETPTYPYDERHEAFQALLAIKNGTPLPVVIDTTNKKGYTPLV